MAVVERVIGASAELTDAGPGLRFSIVRGERTLPAFAIRFAGRVHAYVNECMHQASELDWDEGEFFDAAKLYLVCASHGALYDPATGVCVAGPCRGARLAKVDVSERDGDILCTGD